MNHHPNPYSQALIDSADLRRELHEIVSRAPQPVDTASLRSTIVAVLREHLQKGRQECERRLLRDGRGTQCAKNLAFIQDEIIHALYDLCRTDLFPEAARSSPEIAIIAVGGYGRGTLAPGSDIDLLFLLPPASDALQGKIIEFILYCLWDLRLKVGHSTRSIDDCIKLAKTDNTILTAILESRFICGNLALTEKMQAVFRRDIVKQGARKFIADKLAERSARLIKSGESRYMVEPDVKDGKGGLRDLHTLFWIAKFIYDARTPEELADKGAFTRAELRKFERCENYLWVVRCHLHFISGRSEDRLSFERQTEVASRLGYRSRNGLKNVERFMKHYFSIAKEVGDLTRIFCASLEERQMKDAPVLTRMMGKLLERGSSAKLGNANFKIESGRIALAVPDAFQRDPVNILRLFAVASQYHAEIHPDALKAVRQSVPLIDDKMRHDPEANELFLDMLTNPQSAEKLLRVMNEAGVLGRFIPEFGRIVAMMQFNMYHHYTVDEHLIRAVGVLADLDQGKFAKDHPLASEIIATLKSRRALYVATLLHDIAKGRSEDHSIAGERIARSLGPRLGLTAEETETVAWLVRYHLLMSETAQMRDLHDFKTILDFTEIVQSPERLKLLIILTVCDIRAVGPGVWNGWKGQLLRTLYYEAEPVLTGGHTSISREERVKAAQQAFLEKQPGLGEVEAKMALTRHYPAYWLNVSLEKQLLHHEVIASAKPRDIVTRIQTDAFTAITELIIYAPDHPRLLAMITGACATAGANIMSAQIFTTADGMALDTILIQREFKNEEDEQRRAERVARTIRDVLQGNIRLRDAIASTSDHRSRLKAFTVEPRVIIDNHSSNIFTVIEINGLDRIGLLYDLTGALFQLSVNIGSAHITTFGEKVIDVFYVTDLTGAKIISPTRQTQIERCLMAVLNPSAADHAPQEQAS